jgi:hypothetical protein
VSGPFGIERRVDVNVERMVIGLAVMGVGLALAFAQFGGLVVASRLWPLLLIALGVGKLVTPPLVAASSASLSGERLCSASLSGEPHAAVASASRRGGWLIVVGVWLLLDQLRILRAGDSWPLLLVALGAAMVWKATATRRAGVMR